MISKGGAANPALEKFISSFSDEMVLAQVLIVRTTTGFELRHVEDRGAAGSQLRPIRLSELRGLAQKTTTGAFRPLKSAPNLQRGWYAALSSVAELDVALRDLYPGAVADWFAAQSPTPPITDYRAFTERQTGMYRVTAKSSDNEAAEVIRACCPRQFCLKRRLWTVAGLPIDAPETKSVIPCLEPCAVFLELARTAARINQAEKVALSSDDLQVALTTLQATSEHPDPTVREADFASPQNPRRVQLALEKIRAQLDLIKCAGKKQ